MLRVRELRVRVENTEILGGVNLDVGRGEIVVLMGPNGSGKSSLALSLANHPKYEVVGGEAVLDGKDLLNMQASERSRAGLLLAFQSPVAIPGVSVFHLLREACELRTDEKENVVDFRRRVEGLMEKIGMDKSFLKRSVNEGFSGGERKKMELLQAMLLKPKMLILDEIDSGMDVDSLKKVSKITKSVRENGGGVLIITHYSRVVEYVKPDKIVVMKKGAIVSKGGMELVRQIEKKGYLGVKSEGK